MLNVSAHQQISNLLENHLLTSASVRQFKQLLQEGWSAESILNALLPPIPAQVYAPHIQNAIETLWPRRAGIIPSPLDDLIESWYSKRLNDEVITDVARCRTESLWVVDELIVQGYMSKNMDIELDALIPNLGARGEMLLMFLFSARVPWIINAEPPIMEIEKAVQEIAQEIRRKTPDVELVVDSVQVRSGSIVVEIILESFKMISDVTGNDVVEHVGHGAWAAKTFAEGALEELGGKCIRRVAEIFSKQEPGIPASLPESLISDAPMIETAQAPLITSWFKLVRKHAQQIAESHKCKPKLMIDEEGRSQGHKVYFIYRFRGQKCKAKGVVIVLEKGAQDAREIYAMHAKAF